VKLQTTMTCPEFSTVSQNLTSSFAELMKVPASRLEVSCAVLSGTQLLQSAHRLHALVEAVAGTASSELGVIIFESDDSETAVQVSSETAAATLSGTSKTEIASLSGFPANTQVTNVEQPKKAPTATRPPSGVLSSVQPSLVSAPSVSAPTPSEPKSGLSGGAIFGIVFACLLLIGGALVGAVYYKQKVLEPRRKEENLLQREYERLRTDTRNSTPNAHAGVKDSGAHPQSGPIVPKLGVC